MSMYERIGQIARDNWLLRWRERQLERHAVSLLPLRLPWE